MSQPAIRIVSIGAAVQDVFLQGKIFAAHREEGEYVQEFELGSKNEVESITYSTGGGATNASVTFARQGLHSMYMGRIGHDIAGKAVMDDLHKEGVDTSLVDYDPVNGTGYSVILLAPNGERTILTYRGASKQYELTARDLGDVKPDWFYISSLSGDFESLKTIVDYATKNNIKIAINPGKGELHHNSHFKALLPAFTILGVNKEEMQMLFDGDSTDAALHKAAQQIPYLLVTDGPKGSMASDGTNIYKAGMYEDVKVVDRAGAGDAFNSGFVAMIARGESMETALAFASANSTSVVGQIGAKTGILHESAKLHSMRIEATSL